MSDNLTAGNPRAHRIRVYYEGEDTIYEGMALCYNHDTTTNWFGGSVSDGVVTASTTTAETTLNESRYIRVEKPATANLAFFAGVVARGGWCGTTGPKALDIYVPNGAAVPVRTYISSTAGTNALAIQNGQYYLGNPAADITTGAGRYVAVAMQTVNNSAAKGLCLARLCPEEFVYQAYGATKLDFASAGTSNVAANFIGVHSSQTSGGFTALFVRSEVDTAANNDVGSAIYGEANLLGVASDNFYATRFALNIWGGTQTCVRMSAIVAEIYEGGANLTGITQFIAPLFLRTQIDATNAPAANTHWMIACKVDGADTPDGFLYAHNAAAINMTASDGGVSTHKIPIRVGGTTRYLMVSDG